MLSSYEPHHDCALEVLQEYCKETGINHLVLFKAAESDYVRVCILFIYVSPALAEIRRNSTNKFAGLYCCLNAEGPLDIKSLKPVEEVSH